MNNGLKQYYIYKTTNIINEKYYIGVKFGNTYDDLDLGSDVDLKRDIKKYGKDSFRKEVVGVCRLGNGIWDWREVNWSKFDSQPVSYNRRWDAVGGSSPFYSSSPFFNWPGHNAEPLKYSVCSGIFTRKTMMMLDVVGTQLDKRSTLNCYQMIIALQSTQAYGDDTIPQQLLEQWYGTIIDMRDAFHCRIIDERDATIHTLTQQLAMAEALMQQAK